MASESRVTLQQELSQRFGFAWIKAVGRNYRAIFEPAFVCSCGPDYFVVVMGMLESEVAEAVR